MLILVHVAIAACPTSGYVLVSRTHKSVSTQTSIWMSITTHMKSVCVCVCACMHAYYIPSLPYRTGPCFTLPHRTLPYLTLPYTLPNVFLPSTTLPNVFLPSPTLPYLASFPICGRVACTPLMRAAQRGYVKIAQALLAAGAPVAGSLSDCRGRRKP